MFYVYILASIRRTLYIGVTSDLRRRVFQHKTGAIEGFTARYRVNRLVYFEVAESAEGAIKREKQLKAWVRRRKMELIEAENPEWEDLSDRIGLAEMAVRAV
jgi:putative endonuclease